MRWQADRPGAGVRGVLVGRMLARPGALSGMLPLSRLLIIMELRRTVAGVVATHARRAGIKRGGEGGQAAGRGPDGRWISDQNFMGQMSDTYEHLLAGELGVSKDVLRHLRITSLTPAEDWHEQPGRGIVITESGQKKIRAALAAPPEKEGAPESADFAVVRLCSNPRLVMARRLPVAENADPEAVRLCRRQTVPPARGWLMRGCTWNAQRGGWDFDGRVTRR